MQASNLDDQSRSLLNVHSRAVVVSNFNEEYVYKATLHFHIIVKFAKHVRNPKSCSAAS